MSWPPKALPLTVLFSAVLPPLPPFLPPRAPPLGRLDSKLRVLVASVPETSALEASADDCADGATEDGLRASRGSRAPRPLPPPPLLERPGLGVSDRD